MGLEEKIHLRIKYHTGLYKSNLTKEISEIADDYAVEFGEYLDSLTTEDMGNLSIKELLEIFKKEKEL